MKTYHKIQTMYARTECGELIVGEWANPVFGFLHRNAWVFTEKVDGTNIRVTWDGAQRRFVGKTDNSQIHNALVARLEDLFPNEKLAEIFGTDPACLYGEGYGAKIEKGGGNYNPDGQDFVLIDIRCGDFWLERENIVDVATKAGIEAVPIIGRGPLAEMHRLVEQGLRSVWGDFQAEGIVAKPSVELVARNGARVITKLKTKDFNRVYEAPARPLGETT